MSLAVRRKLFCLLAAASLALMLAGTTISAPALADCNTSSSTTCSG